MDTFASLKELATQFYKSKKNAVELILREAISNAIHACIIERQNNIEDYLPTISICINSNNNSVKITDNGVCFSEIEKYFSI